MKRPPFSPLPVASTPEHIGEKEKFNTQQKEETRSDCHTLCLLFSTPFSLFCQCFPFSLQETKEGGEGGHEERSEERFSNRCAKAHGVDKTACEVLDDTMIACAHRCAPPRLHAWASQPCAQKVDVQCCVLRGAEGQSFPHPRAAPLIERSISSQAPDCPVRGPRSVTPCITGSHAMVS